MLSGDMGTTGKRFQAQTSAPVCPLRFPGYSVALQRRHDKGKPDASPGRKATGPSRAAEFPNVDRPTQWDRRPRSAAGPSKVPPRTEDRGSDRNNRSSSALRTGVGFGRLRDGFLSRRGGTCDGSARSTSSHASHRCHNDPTAPGLRAGRPDFVQARPPRRCWTCRTRVPPRLRPGEMWCGRRSCGDTNVSREEERIPGRRGDGVLGCRG